jgi:Tetratricopeptide repeat
MRRAAFVWCLLLTMIYATGCRSSRHALPEATQENFGVNMARMNLWREAKFRFMRAVEMNPGDAMAHNNLAVAYEANGEFENAAKEYREAMRLDKTNQYIQKNYSRYVEFTSRNKKRQRGTNAPKSASASAAGSSTPATPTVPGATPPPPAPASGDGPGSVAQPTGTAPAAVPPTAVAPTPQPVPPDTSAPPPPPAKPPGDHP